MSGTEEPGAVIERDTHTVRVVGEETDRLDIEIATTLPGEPKTSRSSRDSILGEKGYINLSWSVEVNRKTPIVDDPFPYDMPDTICNASYYGREDRTEGMSPELPLEYIHMDHLYVQDEARGMGYGLLLWDCYLGLVARINGNAHGKVGDGADRSTAAFLKRQGVPDADIEESDSSAWLGDKRAVWETDGKNVLRNAPIRRVN